MAAAHEGFHEENLSATTRDMHRALVSLEEELEAIDWYSQRVEAASDDELREILRHNREEEKEHASMLLEWIRRRDPAFDGALRTYLFSEGSILEREESTGAPASPGTTSVGSLRGGQ